MNPNKVMIMLRFLVGVAFAVAALVPVGVHGCRKNSECGSGWCEGGKMWPGPSGSCGSRLANGAKAPGSFAGLSWDYNKCSYKNGECGYCGPAGSTPIGGKCTQNRQCGPGAGCNSWDSTATGTTAGCTGACKALLADGQTCDSALLTGGADDQCASGKCLELLKTHRYCQPKGGSTDGQRCTEDTDCALRPAPPCPEFTVSRNAAISGHNKESLTGSIATCSKACCSKSWCKSFDYNKVDKICYLSDKAAADVGGLKTNYPGNPWDYYVRGTTETPPSTGLWCDGGGATKAGHCRPCPSHCKAGEGCSACGNNKDHMKCGRTSTGEKIRCAGEIAVAEINKLTDCFGIADGLKCATNLAGEIADCAGGGDCDIEFGEGCLDYDYDGDLKRRRSLNGTYRGLEQDAEDHVHDLTFALDSANDNDEADAESEGDPDVLRLTRRSASDMLTTTGTAKAAAKIRFMVNPKTLQAAVTLTATLDVSTQLKISAAKATKDSGETAKPLGKSKILIKKFMLVGKMPVFVSVSVRPYVFYEITAAAAFTGSLDVVAKTDMTAELKLDITGKTLTPSLTVTPPAPTITPAAGVRGSVDVKARIGLRWTFSVNAVPIKLDTTLAVYLNAEAMYLQGEPGFDEPAEAATTAAPAQAKTCKAQTDAQAAFDAKACKGFKKTPTTHTEAQITTCTPLKAALDKAIAECTTAATTKAPGRRGRSAGCLEGTVTYSAGIDLRLNVEFKVPNPQQVAYQGCMAGMSIIEDMIPGAAGAKCLAEKFGAEIPKPTDLCDMLQTAEEGEGSGLPTSYCAPTAETVMSGAWTHFPMVSGTAALSICPSATAGSALDVKTAAEAKMSLPCTQKTMTYTANGANGANGRLGASFFATCIALVLALAVPGV